MALVGMASAYQTISKVSDVGTPDEPKPDTPKTDTQISPPPLPLPIKVPNLLNQPEVVNDVSATEVPQTPPPIPTEIKKTPDEVKQAVELEIKRIVHSRKVVNTTSFKKDSVKIKTASITPKEQKPPKIKVKTTTSKYPPGSWSERRKELGYSAKDSLVGNPKLMAEYNKWKTSR